MRYMPLNKLAHLEWAVITSQPPHDWPSFFNFKLSIGDMYIIHYYASAGNPVVCIELPNGGNGSLPLHIKCIKIFNDKQKAEEYSNKIKNFM